MELIQIWELDTALTEAKKEGEADLEGIAAPILRGNFRTASHSKSESRLDFLPEN